MKKISSIIILLYILVHSAYGQEPRFIFDNDSSKIEKKTKPTVPKVQADTIPFDSLNKIPPTMPAWKINARTGERIPVPMDTSFIDFHQTTLVDGQDIAVSYLGNWGSPAQSKIYFDRPDTYQFSFLEAFDYYYKRPETQVFYDTKQPLSNFAYYSGGGRQGKEERFTGEMSISFNKKFSIGFNVDYIYSRGYYTSLSNKQINYDVFASYKTDRYQMHILLANNNFSNVENGGLKTIPDNFSSEDTKNLETNMTDTHNNLRGRRLYMTHKYSVGYEKDDDPQHFIPVASAFLTTNYTDQKRRFWSNQTQLLDDSIYHRAYDISDKLNDQMSYYSFKNTLGIALNEGFRPWVKFGLTAFIEQGIRKYTLPTPGFVSELAGKHSQNTTTIGGILSKSKGKFLKYNLSADLGVIGYNSGDYNVDADISTQFKIKDKEFIVKANAYLKSRQPMFYENRFVSRYYQWDKDLSKIHREYIGGEIAIPSTQTRLRGGVENIKNYIYYAPQNDEQNSIDIQQEGKNIQVVSLRLDQKLHTGVLHWDNQVAFQTSSNNDVLPLPKWSLYSNLYLQFKIAKVLGVQLGVDAHYFSSYYAPGYDPALLQFYNQQETKIGNFPFATAYANFHLKKTRFFVMMYNIAKNYKDSNYFTVPNYPVNPMLFKFGLSWNFTN